ncbi:hypothetical protein [Catenovulum agarivorans]|uniref:hypothetical protein n=1 Tax=Catenovulum agarivorans TaxID=1172192 RepID=UPI0003730C07|nr:hypothetical protein [Catenovulum agarivorans]
MGILKYTLKFKLSGILIGVIFPTAIFANDYFVFTKVNEPFELSRQQIKQVFLGARLEKNGDILQPIILAPGHPWRAVFNIRVMGLTESRIQSYWAQVKFTGKRTPPTQVESFKQMLTLIDDYDGAIGIAPAQNVDLSKYQVIYRFTD